MSIQSQFAEGITPAGDAAARAEAPIATTAEPIAPPKAHTAALDLATPDGLREFMKREFDHFLQDAEWRVKQAYEVQNRTPGGSAIGGQVFAEDLDILMHQITGYTMTANSPSAGSIAWTAVHIVYGGVDYTCADGNTANKYVWFTKPASGTTATLQTGNVKPVLGPNDCLVFFNNAGTPINALTSSIPVAVVDGAIDSAAIANGAVTAAKTDFYTSLNTAITNAQNAADIAQATADGAVVTYFQSASPWANGDATAGGASNPAAKVGDIWYDSDDGQAYRWSGASGSPANTWVMIEDNSIAAALTAANNAQTTANGKITTFYAALASPPSATAIGDMWIVTDQGNQLRRATATGTGSWVTVQISGAAIATGGVGNTQLGTGIDGAKLSSGTVGSTQLGTNAVTPTKLNILQHVMF